MKSFLNTVTTAMSNTVLFLVGCVMAGLGLSFVAVLAIFALATAGLALLAAPFVPSPVTPDATDDQAPA